MYRVELSKKVQKKQLKKIKNAGLAKNFDAILTELINNPFSNKQGFEKLQPPVKNWFSRRLNIQHRVVYHIDKESKTVFIDSAWQHYE
ncbi:Txe/YoeB family addiction module toxin [Fructilactobacillus frigidiflavus]|uniref:Txe/YoeB family addiction module toxin n=1 Tax=Fructilactobacillus frigidiflavus TaxID=3242688 RepID=UPI003756C955